MCGGGGAYLWVVVACAAGSVSYVLAKAAAVLPRGAALQDVTAPGPGGMILLSLALAAAHLAAAYRTSCRERRRMLVYRIDVEGAVSTGHHNQFRNSSSASCPPCELHALLAQHFTSAQHDRRAKKSIFYSQVKKKSRVVSVQARRVEPMTGIVEGMIPTNNPGILLWTPNRLCFR